MRKRRSNVENPAACSATGDCWREIPFAQVNSHEVRQRRHDVGRRTPASGKACRGWFSSRVGYRYVSITLFKNAWSSSRPAWLERGVSWRTSVLPLPSWDSIPIRMHAGCLFLSGPPGVGLFYYPVPSTNRLRFGKPIDVLIQHREPEGRTCDESTKSQENG